MDIVFDGIPLEYCYGEIECPYYYLIDMVKLFAWWFSSYFSLWLWFYGCMSGAFEFVHDNWWTAILLKENLSSSFNSPLSSLWWTHLAMPCTWYFRFCLWFKSFDKEFETTATNLVVWYSKIWTFTSNQPSFSTPHLILSSFPCGIFPCGIFGRIKLTCETFGETCLGDKDKFMSRSKTPTAS